MRYLLILVCFLAACKGSKETNFIPDYQEPYAPVIVYKTKKDYSKKVPVILSEDKLSIVSYPAPSDIRSGGDFTYPVQLRKGYLLDKRGIGKNVAFLKFTYEEYAKWETIPSLTELYASIEDKDPLVEMCNCGNKNALSQPEDQLNRLIRSGKLSDVCKRVY